MKHWHKKRLLKLASFLETLHHKKFDFNIVRNECGTVGCAVGWTPNVFPRLVKINKKASNSKFNTKFRYGKEKYLNYIQVAERSFGLRQYEVNALFLSWDNTLRKESELPNNPTPRQVAANIRKFVNR